MKADISRISAVRDRKPTVKMKTHGVGSDSTLAIDLISGIGRIDWRRNRDLTIHVDRPAASKLVPRQPVLAPERLGLQPCSSALAGVLRAEQCQGSPRGAGARRRSCEVRRPQVQRAKQSAGGGDPRRYAAAGEPLSQSTTAPARFICWSGYRPLIISLHGLYARRAVRAAPVPRPSARAACPAPSP